MKIKINSIIKKHYPDIIITAGIIIIFAFLSVTIKDKMMQKAIIGEYGKKETAAVKSIPEIKNNDVVPGQEKKETDASSIGVEKKAAVRSDYKDGMMILDIAKIKIRAKVMNGTTAETLKKGPGLFDISGLPDTEGDNVCIAGHLNVYKKEFRHLNSLVKGDTISLEFNNRIYTYEVEKNMTVGPADWSITYKTGYSALTLMTCHPVYRTKKRFIIRAKLISVKNIKF